MKRPWLARPRAALCAAAAVLALSVLALAGPERGPGSGGTAYTVELRDRGLDEAEAERLIALPLEDALASLAGASRLRSLVEGGRVRTTVSFGADSPDAYDAVREAALSVYDLLPPTAERPEIIGSDGERAPFWTAALGAPEGLDSLGLDRLIERELEPALRRIPGVAETERSGPGPAELVVSVDSARASRAGEDVLSAARALAASDGLFPAGRVRTGDSRTSLALDARFPDPLSAGRAPLPLASGAGRLDAWAVLGTRRRDADSLSRLDGERSASLAVFAAAGADRGRLSAALREALGPFESRGLRFEVLLDRGAEEAEAYRAALAAAAQGTAAAAAFCAFSVLGGPLSRRRGLRAGLACAVSVPFVFAAAAALLKTWGPGLDAAVMGALAAALGSCVDSSLLCAERLAPLDGPEAGGAALRSLAAPLLSGAAATFAVLPPLAALDRLCSGAGSGAAALAAGNAVALFVAFALLPPLLISPAAGKQPEKPRPVRTRSRAFPGRRGRRLLARLAVLDAERPRTLLSAGGLLSACAVLALCLNGADAGPAAPEGELYALAEFDGGLSASAVDERLAAWALSLRGRPGVARVETLARTGSGTLVLLRDPAAESRASLEAYLRDHAPRGAFVHVPEASRGERTWTIAVYGEEAAECRRLASAAAGLLLRDPFVRGAALGFKEGPERLILEPRREALAAAGLGFSAAAETLRRSALAPVAYKRTDATGDTDVRASCGGGPEPSLGDFLGLDLTDARGNAYRVGDLFSVRRAEGSAQLRRDERRRSAAVLVRTGDVDPRRAAERCRSALASLALPPLYSLSFDADALERARAVSAAAWSFAAALVLVYLVLGALSESFSAPLAVLAAAPPSLAVPALLLCLQGRALTPALASAFVAGAGVAINAAALSLDELRRRPPGAAGLGRRDLYRLLRSRSGSLFSSCAVAVSGSLPLLFSRASDDARSLAFVTVFAVGASFFAALTATPAAALLLPSALRPFSFRPRRPEKRPGTSGA